MSANHVRAADCTLFPLLQARGILVNDPSTEALESETSRRAEDLTLKIDYALGCTFMSRLLHLYFHLSPSHSHPSFPICA